MKTNDPYFQAFDKVIPIATTVAAYEASNALAYCFAGLQWAFYAYAHIAVYMSERIGDQL